MGKGERVKTQFIVNPHSSGGKTGEAWPAIEERLNTAMGPLDVAYTTGQMNATDLTRKALRAGAERVISVGGDGTLNEVVNGFFDGEEHVNPFAAVGLFLSGTGGDFRKTFNMPKEYDEQVIRLIASEPRPIDVGRLDFIDAGGRPSVRYFINIASFGLSGEAVVAINSATTLKRMNSKMAFQWGVLKTGLLYRNKRVRIRIDDTFDEKLTISTVAVCNGQYFGSGMWVAPKAVPNDGLFDVIMLTDTTKREIIFDAAKIYRGEHLYDAKIRSARGRVVVAEPDEGESHVFLDVDGEAPGRLPATFRILPGAIKFMY